MFGMFKKGSDDDDDGYDPDQVTVRYEGRIMYSRVRSRNAK